MSKEFILLWFKYAFAVTVAFLVVGFFLHVVVEGQAPAQALALMLEVGVYQSALWAMAVATILTWGKG